MRPLTAPLLRLPAPTPSAPAAGPRPLPDKAPKPLKPLALDPRLPDEIPLLPEPLLLPLLLDDPGLLKELDPTLPPPLLPTLPVLRPTGLWLMPPMLELLGEPRLLFVPPTLLDDCPRLRSGVLTPLDPVAFAPVPEPSTPPAVPVDVPALALKPVLGVLDVPLPPDPDEVLAPLLLLVPDGLLKLFEPELAPAPTPPVPLLVPPPGLVPSIGAVLVLPPACARTIGGWLVLSASARVGAAI